MESRRREDAAIRLEQRFEDWIKGYESDKEESLRWRATVDARISPLEELYRILSTPARVIGWLIVVMMTPVLGLVGFHVTRKIFEWFTQALERGR